MDPVHLFPTCFTKIIRCPLFVVVGILNSTDDQPFVLNNGGQTSFPLHGIYHHDSTMTESSS